MNVNDILLEADLQNNAIDPKLTNLINNVDGIANDKQGSIENFLASSKNDYHIQNVDSLRTSMMRWLKYPILGVAGFAIVKVALNAVANGSKMMTKIVPQLKGAGLSAPLVGLTGFCIVAACLAYILYKIFKRTSSSKITESLSQEEVTRYSELTINKICLESEIFYSKLNRLFESQVLTEAVGIKFIDSMLKKAYSICQEMFSWVRNAVRKATDFAKKHPFLITAIVIISGFIFSYFKFPEFKGRIDVLIHGVPPAPPRKMPTWEKVLLVSLLFRVH